MTAAVAAAQGLGEPLLATTTIAKSFGPVVALRSVQLSVAPGEVHALLGANGAGKSTLVKILTGVVRPDAGEIHLRGHPVSFSSPADARRHGLAPVFQDPALVADLTVRENLRLTRADVRAVQAELEQMGLAGLDLDEQVRDIPLPFLRMIDLARAVSFDPLVLLLDKGKINVTLKTTIGGKPYTETKTIDVTAKGITRAGLQAERSASGGSPRGARRVETGERRRLN